MVFIACLAGCAPGARYIWVKQVLGEDRERQVDRERWIADQVELLGSDDPAAVGRAGDELVSFGPQAHRELLLAARYRPDHNAARAVRVYARTGTAQGLIDIFHGLPVAARIEAAVAMADLAEPVHVPVLCSWLDREPVAEVRRVVLRTLAVLEDRRAVPALVEGMNDPVAIVADTAMEGLVALREEERLRKLWLRADAPIRARILRALARMRAGRDLGLSALEDPSVEVRAAAIGTLDARDADSLFDMLEDPSWTVFLAARQRLSRVTGRIVIVEGGDSDDQRRRTIGQWKKILNP